MLIRKAPKIGIGAWQSLHGAAAAVGGSLRISIPTVSYQNRANVLALQHQCLSVELRGCARNLARKSIYALPRRQDLAQILSIEQHPRRSRQGS